MVEINGPEENATVLQGIQDAGIIMANTIAIDGGGGAYVWLGGNDFANEGNWTWDGKNEGNGTVWDGNTTNGASQVGGLFNNWGAPLLDH